MVRISRRVGAAAAAATLVASCVTAAAASAGGISLELHRIPDSGQRYETYQRRRLHGNGDGFEVVPLNPGMGTHYAWVYAGTPPQRASVITDTGSHIMAFPCSGCDGCGTHTDQPFAALESTTLTHVTCSDPSYFRCEGCGLAQDKDKKTCDISQAYMEGSSWHATVVEDLVYLGGEASANDTSMRNAYGTHFRFGCQSSETGLFITQVADGIMGLANNDYHIVAKLYREKKIPNKLFSLCFAPEGGSMSIGVPDTSRHKGNISYAKLKPSGHSDFYGVELRDVRIAGTSIEPSPTSLSFGQFIVDSGTTDSYLPSSMKTKFQELFKKFSGMDYHTSSSACLGYTDADLDKLPNVEYILGAENGENMTLVIPPSKYLLKEENGKYCSSIFLSEGSGGVIGANIMMDNDVIFDQGNQRVGFVEADCDYRRLSTNDTTSTNSTMNGAAATTTPAPSQAAKATAAPTEEPAPTKATVTPSPSPTTVTPKPTEPTAAPTETPTAAPTEAPTVAPTEAPTPVPTKETPAPTVTKTPEPTTAVTITDKGVNNAALNSSGSDEPHPVVLTIVGTALAVAFIVIAAFSLRRRKKNKRDTQWSRVNETEGDDDDDDDEEELIIHTPSQKSKAKKAPGRSDEFDDDDDDDASDDNNSHRGGRISSNDDDDDDDDDEIFDRDVEAETKHSHDARVLERL